ncbi:hypothetical protein PV327_009192 [Microctonus hyperodae]|uniref:F-box domain-containing protein n=1 Tax=Microctonus hyperodae TaxID=165561 RepID=A0AA39FTV9_MICHY|nr:hypothetical protein PV327_009192 [Microctonus hyperodae]
MVSVDEMKVDFVPIKKNKNGGEDECVKFIEQFVKEVTDFSSQYGSNNSISYTAYNIVGNPSKFPDYGDFPQAFVMKTYGKWWDEAPSRLIDFMPQNNEPIDSHDFIDIEYDVEVYPIRLSIYEIYNPGSVVRIWARDSLGQWWLLWNGSPQIVSHKSRIFSPPLKLCSFKTKLFRLEFNHSLLDYYTELDAVLLHGTTELIMPRAGAQCRDITELLKQLSDHDNSMSDPYNLTPDYSLANIDLIRLKRKLHEYCVLYKSDIIDKIPKSKLLSKLGFNCQCIPPIEEACNSLQKFLQDDFPKLIKEINDSVLLSANSSVNSDNLEDSENERSGRFSVLPDETVLTILKHLDLRSLCRCCRVNKYFNTIARDALLYKSLNLKPYWHCIDAKTLNILSTRCDYLQRLDFSWCGSYGTITSQNFIDFLNSCGSLLTHLRLNCCRFVDDNVIAVISRVCKNLKELCLRNCSEITYEGFIALSKLNHLERLELYMTSIETLELCSILNKNPQMRHLNLASMRDRVNMDEVAAELASSCPYLESVDFWKSRTLTATGVRALSHCTNLREVDFGWCGGVGVACESLRIFLSKCCKLEKVFLGSLRGITDRDIEPLLRCEKLQQLDLLGAHSLTPNICCRFLVCCPELRMIDLSFCGLISTLRVQEWRQCFPYVSIKKSTQATDIGDFEFVEVNM